MSDDLTPAEQARAHRLSAQALYERYPNAFGASRYALGEIADHLDPPAPPETVESLRAERDSARNKLAQTECAITDYLAALNDMQDERDNAIYWRDHNADEADTARAELDRLRATHTEAEAAWERCKRQPRVWQRGDSVPDVATRVRDKQGDVWNWRGGGWTCRRDSVVGAADWETVLIFSPLTEVLDED